ncbi:uncharacterized protein EI90DRAFT_3063689 [Cantharellus anzutake]|uniref:uncharacterized protein n=1 Tax=Cantharellus anzutake TaxID=1750568 RepID=UPI001906FB17|nr:uncharacterized protein EI90DRAFT_3063689 [Cantharellus anzutake]KAF8328821.1 hypothetical protein EI90DRAFT_3063689 [Cantharellus anzutake]
MLSLTVDHFFTLILPRRPSASTMPLPPTPTKKASNGIGFRKRRRTNHDSAGSSDDADREFKKRVKADENSQPAQVLSTYPYSHRPPLHVNPSTTFSLTPSVTTSTTVPISCSNDVLRSCDTIKPTITKKYFAPKNRSDLIIWGQGNEMIEFYVDSQTIFTASPVLQLQTVHYGFLREDLGVKRAILSLDETSGAIDSLLRLIYPRVKKPRVESSERLSDLLDLCQRYAVAQAIHYLCSTALRDLVREYPLRAYGIACRFNLKSEIPSISREILRADLSKTDLGYDLAYCTPDQVKRILKFHERRAGEAIKLVAEVSAEGLTCGGEYCEDGVAEWWLEVVKGSRHLLQKKPITEELFSPEFLAGCCRRAAIRCSQCPFTFLSSRSQHKLAIVKDQIDSLPCRL